MRLESSSTTLQALRILANHYEFVQMPSNSSGWLRILCKFVRMASRLKESKRMAANACEICEILCEWFQILCEWLQILCDWLQILCDWLQIFTKRFTKRFYVLNLEGFPNSLRKKSKVRWERGLQNFLWEKISFINKLA